jgi:hypothetical protein
MLCTVITTLLNMVLRYLLPYLPYLDTDQASSGQYPTAVGQSLSKSQLPEYRPTAKAEISQHAAAEAALGQPYSLLPHSTALAVLRPTWTPAFTKTVSLVDIHISLLHLLHLVRWLFINNQGGGLCGVPGRCAHRDRSGGCFPAHHNRFRVVIHAIDTATNQVPVGC